MQSKTLKKIREGDYYAFTELYLQYVFSLQRFLTRLTGSFEQSEEIVQIVFIKIWENRERIDPEKNFKSYLFTISRNEAYDYLKRRKRFSDDRVETIEKSTPSTYPSAVEDIIYSENYEAVTNAIEKMPAVRKEVFKLYLDGLSNREIAEILGTTQDNVRMHIMRARESIKRAVPLM